MAQKFKLGKDIMKNKKEQIEKKVVELKTQFQDELTEKKNSIIADLESHEKSLLSVVKQNPWLWDSNSLEINVKSLSLQNIASSIDVNVEIRQVFFQIRFTLVHFKFT